MQNVEAAIGEADAQPLVAPRTHAGVESLEICDDLFLGGKRRVRQQLAAQFVERHRRGALLADSDRRAGIGGA